MGKGVGLGEGSGEGSGNGLGSCISKCLLIVINIGFALVGVGICAVGVCIKYAGDILEALSGNGLTDGLIRVAQQEITTSLSSGSSGTMPASINLKEVVDQFIGGLAIPLIVFGLALLIVAVVGMCGACCNSRIVLILYVLIMAIIILAEIIVVVLVVTGLALMFLTDFLQQQLQSSYVGFDNFGGASIFFNLVMYQLNCCGVYNYTDFNNAVNWQRARNFTFSGFTREVNLTIPALCCARDGGGTPDRDCIVGNITSTNSYMDLGCYQAVLNLLQPYELYTILVLVGVFVFEVILVIMSILVIIAESDNDKVSVL